MKTIIISGAGDCTKAKIQELVHHMDSNNCTVLEPTNTADPLNVGIESLIEPLTIPLIDIYDDFRKAEEKVKKAEFKEKFNRPKKKSRMSRMERVAKYGR